MHRSIQSKPIQSPLQGSNQDRNITPDLSLTRDPDRPEHLPFREMVTLPQSLFCTEFLGTPVLTHAPSRAPKPGNPKLSVPGVTFGALGA